MFALLVPFYISVLFYIFAYIRIGIYIKGCGWWIKRTVTRLQRAVFLKLHSRTSSVTSITPCPKDNQRIWFQAQLLFHRANVISNKLSKSNLFLWDKRAPLMHKIQWAWIYETAFHYSSHLCDTATVLHHALRNSQDIKFLQVFKLHLFPPTSTACSWVYKYSTVQLCMCGSVLLRKIGFKKHTTKHAFPSVPSQSVSTSHRPLKKAHLYWTALYRACDLQHYPS